MKFFITLGSHWEAPGNSLLASATREGAVREAVRLINIMKMVSGMPGRSSPETWEADLIALQDKHGAQYIDVSVTELELPDAPAAPPSADAAMLTAARAMLHAIVCRIQGVWDDPTLMAFGPIGQMPDDVLAMAELGLKGTAPIANPTERVIHSLKRAAYAFEQAKAAPDDLARIRAEAKAYDDKLDDSANQGKSSRAPTGEDYNELLGIIGSSAPAKGGSPDAPRMFDKIPDIDANGADISEDVFTVEEVETGLLQSVFPKRLAMHSALHVDEAHAWNYISEVRKADPQCKHYGFTPITCPSKHWNGGNDICDDCGVHLDV